MRRTTFRSRATLGALVLAVVVALTVPFTLTPAGAQEDPATSGSAPTGNKGVLSSALDSLAEAPAIASRSADDEPSAADVEAQLAELSLPTEGAGAIMVREDGRVVVNISVASTDDAVVDAVTAAGAVVTTVAGEYRTISAEVALTDLTALAEVPGVLAVTEVPTPLTSSNASATQTEGPGEPPVATNVVCATNPTGIKSEGDTQLQAATARTNSAVDGTGIKVGILSDTFNRVGSPSVTTDVTNAELPGPTNPCGNTTAVQVLDAGPGSGSDEGRAMTQIVHDLAPKASLAFSSAFNSDVDFANEIRALQSAGSKVIVDDVSYFTEPFYQDGPIAAAVNDVTAAGSTYFSSAGNSTPQSPSPADGGSYEAMAFRSISCPASVTAFDNYNGCHDYNAGAGTDATNQMSIPSGAIVRTTLGWSEPMFGVGTDLDLFLLDANTGNRITQSVAVNTSTGSPVEFIGWQNTGAARNVQLVVARYAPSGTATPRLKVIVHRNPATSVEWKGSTVTGTDVAGPTIFGHNSALKAGSIAAIPYNNANTVEPFSSRGPAAFCWQPVNGTSPSPAMACQTKQLDVAATDGTRNSFFGSFDGANWRFYGTSAAAPHAAAVAALQTQKQPCRTPAQFLAAQRSSAATFGSFTQADYGSGRLVATTAITGLAVCNPPVAAGYHPLTPERLLDSRGPNGGWNAKLVAGASRELQITGRGTSNIPGNASAVVMNVTVTSSTDGSFLKVWPAGSQSPNVSNLNFSPNQTIPNLVTVRLGTGGKVEFANAVGSVHVIADVVGYFDNGSGPGDTYTAVDPVRLLDSRFNNGFNGTVNAGTPRTVGVTQLTRANGVPNTATAVIANVTVVGASNESFLKVWPTGSAEPNVSNLNFGAGQIIPNLTMVKIGTGGTISISNAVGSTHVVMDVVGYFTPSGGSKLFAIDPTRIQDSRFGPGLLGTWNPQQSRTLQVTGGVVPAGATGIIGNFTVADGNAVSLLTLYPNGTTLPTASNLNFGPGQIIPNLAAVRLPTSGGGTGKISIYNDQGNVNVIADVVGYFAIPV